MGVGATKEPPDPSPAFVMRLTILVSVALTGCALPRVVTRPWNFPSAKEWNDPMEFAWQPAVDTWKRWTAPKTKTINGMSYEYDDVTMLYFPNLAKFAESK